MRTTTPLVVPVCEPPAPAAGRSQLHGDVTGLAAGTGMPVFGVQTALLTSQVTRASTTLLEIEELQLPVEPDAVYIFEFSGTYSVTGEDTTAIVGAVGGPTGASNVIINHHWHVGVGDDTWHNGCTTSFGATNTPAFYDTSSGNPVCAWRLYGSFETGSQGGVIAPRFARDSGSETVIIQAGAYGWVRRIG